jgi:hypothetical protein
MKAILLASGASALLFILGTWRLRSAPARGGAATLLGAFLVVLAALTAAYLLTPPDLGILHPRLQIRPAALDFAFALFLFGAAFFGGILQLYNLAERGLSLRMLIDILHSSKGEMTVEEVRKSYGGGRGIASMYEKRLDGLCETGLAVRRGGDLALTERGRQAAAVFSRLRQFVRAQDA